MNEMVTSTGTGGRAGRREWMGLGVLALPALLVSIDVFVMLMAVPHLSADLHASGTEQLWIMDVYGFMIAGFLVTMGTLGDRIGRRRLLLVGAAAFAGASVLAAYAPNPEALIGARALLGVAGATVAPCTLALISNMFADPRQRSLAIGVWLVCFMGGAAVGPVFGGAMLERFWWGSVFLLGVPAMALLLALGPVLLPEYRDPTGGRPDLASVALSLAAILPVIYGVKEIAREGWRPVPAAAVLAGIVIGAAFVRRQRRLADPLLDLRLFRSRSFGAALGGMFSITLLGGAVMVFITQHLQLVEGLSPLEAGLWLLPGVAATAVGFLASPLLARRVRPAYLIGAGLLVSVAGMVSLTRVDATSGLVALVTGFAVSNLGAGPMVTLGTDLVVGSAPVERAGSAGAINETSGEFGFALGIALFGSVGAAVYRAQFTIPSGVPDPAGRVARESAAGAVSVADRLPEPLGAAVLDVAHQAYTSALHTVAAVAALLLLAVAISVAILLRHVRPSGTAGTTGAAAATGVAGPADASEADPAAVSA